MRHARPLALAALFGAAFFAASAASHAEPPRAADEPRADGLPEMVLPADTSDAIADEIGGEIVVDVRDDADPAAVGSDHHLALRANSPWSDAHDKIELATVPASDEDRVLDELRTDPRVEHAEHEVLYKASFVPNDPMYASKQWHLKRVGAESAWEYACGQGVTVAVIDTGVACYDTGSFMKGTDLKGTRCVGGYNFVDDVPEAYDDHGHGTHVAGTIAQTTNNGVGVAGLAYCARLMPVKVLSKQGYGTVADVAEGIRFAADEGAQVINMSLGGPIKSDILEDAVKHALAKKVTIVAAAGNSGRSVGYPAAYPGVIAVSATDSNDKIAWFSSRGPEVAIAAPGVGVTQQTVCNGGKNKCEIFGTFSGTSMASPHVAGAAAMLVGLGVTDPADVRADLQASAVKKDDAKLYGAGILDGSAAAKRVWWTHVAFRAIALLGLLALLGAHIKKKGGELVKSKATVFGALIASIGLLPFLPITGLLPRLGAFRWVGELLARPIGEWDLVFDASWHRWLVLASAIPAMFLTAFLFGAKRARPVIGGVAVGTAALLAQLGFMADSAFIGGSLLLRVFAVVNVALCLWIARITLDKKHA